MITINEGYFDEVINFLKKNGYEKGYLTVGEEVYNKDYFLKNINWEGKIARKQEIRNIKLTHYVVIYKSYSPKKISVEVSLNVGVDDYVFVFDLDDKELSSLAHKAMDFLSKRLKIPKLSSANILQPNSSFESTDKKSIERYIYKVGRELPKLIPQIKSILRLKQKGRM